MGLLSQLQIPLALVAILHLAEFQATVDDFAGVLVAGGPSSYSGQHSTTSMMMRQGFELWAFEVNKSKSLVIGGVVFAVKLIFEDDASTVEGAEEAMSRVLPAVDIVLAPYGSSLTLAILPQVQAAGKVMFVSAGSSDAIYSQGARVIGLLPPSHEFLKSSIALLQKLGAQSISFLMDAGSIFSVTSCTGALEEATKLGLAIRGNETFVEGNVGAMSQIGKLRLQEPDVLVSCGYLDDAVFVASACKMLNFVPRALVLLNAASASFWDALGEANANQLLSVVPWHPTLSETAGHDASEAIFSDSRSFKEAFQQRFGVLPTYHAAAAAASGLVIANAVASSGYSDADSLVAAARNVQIESSFYGRISFDSRGQVRQDALATMQIQNSRAVAVTEKTMTYPMQSWFQRELVEINSHCPSGSVPTTNRSACVPCEAGYYRSKLLLRCTKCSPGSFSDSPGASQCGQCRLAQSCPSCYSHARFAECSPDQTQTIATQGYYKLPAGEKLTFAPCDPPELCLGNNTCKWPNRGILCAQCDEGYSNQGKGDYCASICPDIGLNLTRIIAVLCLYIMYVSVVVKIVQGKARGIKDLTTTVVRLLMNYLALTSTAIRFVDMDIGAVGTALQDFMRIADISGDPSETFMDLSCVFRHFGAEPVYCYTVLGNILLPIVVVICGISTTIGFLLYKLFKYKIVGTFLDSFVSNSAVALFIFHPIASKLLFKGLECRSLDILRVSSNFDLECSDGEYTSHSAHAIVGIIVWGFGTPLAAALILFQSHAKGMLNSQSVRNRYGFLYNGFEPKYWYFEMVYMCRKVCFMSALVIPYQTFRRTVMICFGVLFLTIHLNCKPFDNRSFYVLDKLETRNLRAFNSALVVQLIIDTVNLLRRDDGEPLTFPASFLLSEAFSTLLLLYLLVNHVLFLSLAISTMAQEKFLKPNRFFLDHLQMMPGNFEPSKLQLFCKRFVPIRTMKYDETDTGVLDFRLLNPMEKEYVMESFGEFLTTSIVRYDQFHPISLAVTIRHAVERIYRHRARIVQAIRSKLIERENHGKISLIKRVGSMLMDKAKKNISGDLTQKPNTSPVFDDIDTSWVDRFRADGFTAEELNNILNIMQNAGESDDLNYNSPTIRTESNTPQPLLKSPNVKGKGQEFKAFSAVLASGSPFQPNIDLDLPNCKGVQTDPERARENSHSAQRPLATPQTDPETAYEENSRPAECSLETTGPTPKKLKFPETPSAVTQETKELPKKGNDRISRNIMDNVLDKFVKEEESLDTGNTNAGMNNTNVGMSRRPSPQSPAVTKLDLKTAKLHAKLELEVMDAVAEQSYAQSQPPDSKEATSSILKRRANASAGSDHHSSSASGSGSSNAPFHKALTTALATPIVNVTRLPPTELQDSKT